MTATVRPSDKVAGEWFAWCRACKTGSGFGLERSVAEAWAGDHNANSHPGVISRDDPDLNLTAASRALLRLRELGFGHDPFSPEAQRYDAALALWCTLLSVPFDNPGDAVEYARRIDASPVRVAVVPL